MAKPADIARLSSLMEDITTRAGPDVLYIRPDLKPKTEIVMQGIKTHAGPSISYNHASIRIKHKKVAVSTELTILSRQVVSQQGSPLLDLALEIRLKIYHFLFIDSKVHLCGDWKQANFRWNVSEFQQNSILYTCCQCYQEARELFCRAAHWDINQLRAPSRFLRLESDQQHFKIWIKRLTLHSYKDFRNFVSSPQINQLSSLTALLVERSSNDGHGHHIPQLPFEEWSDELLLSYSTSYSFDGGDDFSAVRRYHGSLPPGRKYTVALVEKFCGTPSWCTGIGMRHEIYFQMNLDTQAIKRAYSSCHVHEDDENCENALYEIDVQGQQLTASFDRA